MISTVQRPLRARRQLLQVIFLVLIALAVVAGLIASAGTAGNPSSSFPITVDGASTGTQYTGMNSLGFTSGSLYRDPSPANKHNTSTFVVSNVDGQIGQWFVGKIESTRITADTYAVGSPGDQVAQIDLTVMDLLFNPIQAHLLVYKGAGPGFVYSVELDGIGDFAPADLGILIATQVTTDNSFGAPALVTEFAIPVPTPANPIPLQTLYPVGAANRITATYFTPGTQKWIQVSDGIVTVDANAVTLNNSNIVPQHVDMVIGNIGSVDPNKNGNVPVDLRGVPAEVLSDNNLLSHIVLRDLSQSYDSTGKPKKDFVLHFYTDGAHPNKMNPPKFNGDGTVDLKLFFPTKDLQILGGFNINTIEGELAGLAMPNGVNGPKLGFASKAAITVSLP